MQFDAAVIACNTAHLLYDDISQIFELKPVPLISCAQHAISKKTSRLGVLGSPTTISQGLYANGTRSVVVLDAAEQRQTEQLIRQVIAGKKPPFRELERHIATLRQFGAEQVILGCTELSVIADGQKLMGVIDPLAEVVPLLFQDIMEDKHD